MTFFTQFSRRTVPLALFGFLLSTGCGPLTTEPEAQETAAWSYDGDTGPAQWGDLDPAYSAAKDGKQQSPIDIVTTQAEPGELPPLGFNYPSSVPIDVFNNGHTIQADVPEGAGLLQIGTDTFQLRQFHFHAPSEHLIDGKQFALEMHLVHASSDDTLAVVGVFVEKGSEHEELAKLWGDLPTAAPDGHGAGAIQRVTDFDLNKILPTDRASYRYPGSLTTPKCSEGVHWNVLAAPIEMSADQIAAFVKLFSGDEFPDGNRRPVQPLNDRSVKTDTGESSS